jgi:hypothetical protein
MDAEGDPLWTAPGTATVQTKNTSQPEPVKQG